MKFIKKIDSKFIMKEALIPFSKMIFFVFLLPLITYAQFSSQDIGDVSATGSYTESSGTYTILGSGADIWGTSDEFHYVYLQASGDCEISARIVSISYTNGWAKAGVMIRETLDEGSKHAFACMTYSNGYAFQRRTTTDGSSSNDNFGASTPYYVKITRSGDTFTSAYSSDGSTWVDYESETITMNETVYIGLAVTSHSDGSLCTSEFDNVEIPEVDADFSADETVVEVGSTVNFTNASTNATTFSWTFDGGTPSSSSDENPSVTYNSVGIYSVSLTATDAFSNSDTETKSSYITVTNAVEDITDDGGTISATSGSDVANLIDENYSNYYTSSDVPFTIQYDAAFFYIVNEYTIYVPSAGSSYQPRSWEFLASNDGSTWETLDTQSWTWFTGTSQTFSITNTSTYKYFQLNVTELSWRNESRISELEIFGYKVVTSADFTADNTTIYRTQSVNFTNSSVSAVNYNWTFSGGTPGSSTDENPTVTYNTVGTYDVTLVADDGSGNSDTETKTSYITVQAWPAPTADFTGSPTSIDNGETVTFTNSSTNATSYSWTFEGGTPATSSDENPTVTYSSAGTYDVTLEVENVDGATDSETKSDYINVALAAIDITNDGGTLDEPSGGEELIDDDSEEYYSERDNSITFEYTGVCDYIVEEYTITAGYIRTGGGGGNRYYAPNGWTLYGSNDGSSWTTLDTQSGVSFSSSYESQDFSFTNSSAYSHYSIIFSSNAGGRREYTAIGEIEIFGVPQPTADFSSSTTAAYPDYSISFYDESVLAVSYSWSFPGGTPSSSTAENPVVTYSSVGTYDVSLTITDASGNTDTELKTDYISIVSPPSEVPGAGHTYNFAGQTGSFKVPDDPSLTPDGTGTIEAWIYVHSYSEAGGIVHKGEGLSDQEYSLQLKLEEMPKVTVDLGSGGDGAGREILLSSTQMQLETYYHIAVTWDDDNDIAKLYINGRLDNISEGVSFSVEDDDGPLEIGCQDDPPVDDYAFDGIIDEVRIWDAELSQTRIRDWMCKKVTPEHPDWESLNAYYRFENAKSSGSITLEDISLNDNDGYGLDVADLEYIWSPFPVGDDAVYTIDPLSSLYYTTSESDSVVMDYIIGDFNYAAIVYNDMPPNYEQVGGDSVDIFTDHYWDIWSDENSATFDFYYYYNDYQSAYEQDNFRLLSRDEPADSVWNDSYSTNNTANGEFGIVDMFLRQQFCLGGSDAEPYNGNKYYVRPDGDNSNDGSTPATAWATITYAALQSLGPRDTIFIAAGTYAEFDVSHSGSATFPIVYYGDTTGEYFDEYASAGEISVSSSSDYSAEISDQSNIALVNMTFEDATQAGLYLNSASNIRVEDCTFSDNGSYSINAVSTSGYLKIKDNEITSGSSSGIRVASSSGTIDITGNEILKTSGSNLGNGIEIYDTDFNKISENAIVGVTDGINITSCPVAGDIKENTIVNPTDYGIYVDDAENGSIQNNLIYGDGTNSACGIYMTDCDFNVINNTIDNVGGSYGDYGIYGNNCDDGIWKNNIVTNNYYGMYYTNGTPEVNYNCLNGNTYTYTGYNSINSDPLYVDPDGDDDATGIDNWRDDDYHIQSTYGSYHGGAWTGDGAISPCIDAGTPEDSYLNELEDNGDRINCGRYGGTDQASLSGGLEEIFAAPDSSWIMLGVPLIPADNSPYAVYGDDFGAQMPLTIDGTDTTWNGWMCIRWEVDDESSEYYEYGDESVYQPHDCEPGISHFIYHNLDEVVDIDLEGTAVSTDVYQDVAQKPDTDWGPTAYGLNMFANPFLETVDMGSFRVVKDGTEYTIPDAATNGWISPYLYTWSYVSQNYDTYLINDLSDVYPIPKWQGFWFAQLDTDSELQLKMPFDGRVSVGKVLAEKEASDATEELSSLGSKYYLKESSYDKKWDWFLKFGVVSEDYQIRDLENFVGVYENAKNETDPWDGIDVSVVSQMQDEYVQLYMPHEEGGVYSSDIHSQENDVNKWSITVTKKSDKEDFVFLWPHIRQVPQNIKLSLLNAEKDTLVTNLRNAEGYQFSFTEDSLDFHLVSAKIEDDTPPEFTFSITQNHYLPEYVTLYIVPDEPLENLEVEIDGETAEYTKLNSPPNLYKVNFSIADNELPDISISGIDYSGNTNQLEIQKGTNVTLAKVTTQSTTTVETQEFSVSFSENVFQRQTPIIVSNLPQELTYPTDIYRIGNPISLTPEDLSFNNVVTLSYCGEMNYSDASLYKYANNKWEYVAQYDEEMEIPETGIYALFSETGEKSNESIQIATDFELANPAPNPFNNSTIIRYYVKNGSNINLSIYNLLGERVAVLENKYIMQGEYSYHWEGKSTQGKSLPSGIYFVKMYSSKRSIVKKITLLK